MPRPMSVVKTTFRSLKYRNFRLFWIGQCVSLIGTWMQRTAQTWLVLQLTKSAFLVGLMGVFQFLPIFIFSLIAGVVADRFSKRNLMLITQIAFMVQAIIMTLLTHTNSIQYWHVVVLVFLYGVTQTFDMPARQAFFFDMVGKEDLMNAISLNSTIVNIAKIIGPVISGVILSAFGYTACFLINAISFLAVIASLLMIPAGKPAITAAKKNMFNEVSEGIRFIRRSEVLTMGVVFMLLFSIFVMNTNVIIPVFSDALYGDNANLYTGLMSAIGIGALIGAMYMAYSSKYGLRKHLLVLSGSITSVLFVLTFFLRQYIISFIILIPVGFFNMMFMNTANALFQVNSPNEYRGRVMSVYAFINQGSYPIGNTFSGAIMQWFGGASGFIICGILTLLGLFGVFVTRRKALLSWMSPKADDEPVLDAPEKA